MNADPCTYDFMQLIQAKNTVMRRQKRSVAVTMGWSYVNRFWQDTRKRCNSRRGCRPVMH